MFEYVNVAICSIKLLTYLLNVQKHGRNSFCYQHVSLIALFCHGGCVFSSVRFF